MRALIDRSIRYRIRRSPAVRGQGLVEYALILLLVAVALVGALVLLQGTLMQAFTDFAAAFP